MRPERLIFVLAALVVVAAFSQKITGFSLDFLEYVRAALSSETLSLPLWIDYAAVFVFGITGTLTARAKGYDFVGAFVLAGITALGGALLRDGLCLQRDISPIFSDGGYMASLVAAWLFGLFFGEFFMRFDHFIVLCDAAGLGLYAVFGTNKALANDLSIPVAIGVGMINAVGGGLLRDIIARDEPMVFKPGQFYTVIAVFGGGIYVMLRDVIPPTAAAAIVVVFTVVGRIAAIRFDLHSQSVAETQARVRRILTSLRELRRRRHNLPKNFFDDIDDYDNKFGDGDNSAKRDSGGGNAVDQSKKN